MGNIIEGNPEARDILKGMLINHFYRVLLLLLVGGLLASCASRPVSPHPTQVTPINGATPSPAGTLLWSDEFNGAHGAYPDQSKWALSTGGNGWGSGQLQYDTTNAIQDGQGNLVISAKQTNKQLPCWYGACKYVSARITTNKRLSFTYGELDAELTIPAGKGIWSAFWLVGADCATVGFPACGEIDIAESKGDGIVIGSIHSTGMNMYKPYGNFAGSPHRYTLRWTAEQIDLLIDGTVSMTVKKSQLGSTWAFDHPFYIILDVAVGGQWPGSPDGTTTFPQQMLISHVRLMSI